MWAGDLKGKYEALFEPFFTTKDPGERHWIWG